MDAARAGWLVGWLATLSGYASCLRRFSAQVGFARCLRRLDGWERWLPGWLACNLAD